MKLLLPVVKGSSTCEHLDKWVVLIWLSNLKFIHPNKQVRFSIGWKANAHHLATKLVTQQVDLLPNIYNKIYKIKVYMINDSNTQLSR